MNVNQISPINSGYYIDNNINNEIMIGQTSAVESGIEGQLKKSNDNELNQNNTEDGIVDKKQLDKSLNKLNRFLEDESAHAEYSVHKDLGTVMIKIIDDTTKEVILEVPPQKILDMVASMCKQFGLIDKKA